MPEIQPQERTFFAFLPRVATVATLVAAVAAGSSLLGWIVGVYVLAELWADAPRMAPITAIALLLLCGSLWLVKEPGASSRRVALARLLAAGGILIGAVTLFGYFSEADVGLDGLFNDNHFSPYPGQMSPHVAVLLVCLGLWLLTIDLRRGGSRISDVLAPLVGLGALAALIGWVYGVDYVEGSSGGPGIAPQTVIAVVGLFVALLAARPQSPWMRLVTGPGAGGHLMRRFVPILIFGAVIAGDLLMRGVQSGLWSVSVGSAFVVAALVTALLAGLVQISRQLEWADAERRRLEVRLVELADRDPLTNVFNRRRFDEELRRHFALYQRHGTRIAILSIDLDDFKAINDTYGHAAGDTLLVATADVLREQLRASDIAARFGGDEFVVLLPELDEPAAQAVADKLIRAFHAVKRAAPDGSNLKLRASIGIALSNAAVWSEPDALLIAADKALYEEKREAEIPPYSRQVWVVN